MISKVKQALLKGNINENSKLAVAFSGGCDSAAMLHALYAIQPDIGYSLYAIHINHGIRGEEADRDEEFVLNFCKCLDIECYLHRKNIPLECKITGEGTELCARRIRYEIFDRYVSDGYTVATAHSASDNAETVLFNLSRGTGLKGLCGIPFVRDGYIRPILNCSREDTEKYCFDNNVKYVTDSTNLSDDYTRNRIRHNIIPELKKINSSIDFSVLSMSEQLRDIESMLNAMTEKAYIEAKISDTVFNRNKVLNLDKPILSRLVRKIIANTAGINADFKLTNVVCDTIKNCGKTQISYTCHISVTKSKIYIHKESDICNFNIPFTLGEFKNDFFKINISKSQFVNNSLMQSTIDCDKIIGEAVIRNRLAGDCIKLSGRPTKQLRKLMNELEVPVYLRDCVPVIADEVGVIYAPYIGIAERVLPNENSNNLFIVKMEGNDND